MWEITQSTIAPDTARTRWRRDAFDIRRKEGTGYDSHLLDDQWFADVAHGRAPEYTGSMRLRQSGSGLKVLLLRACGMYLAAGERKMGHP